MPSSEKSIKVNVEVVVSQAKAAMADMAATTQKAADQLSKMGASAQTGMAGVTGATATAQGAVAGFFRSTTASIVAGIASYNLLSMAVRSTVGFVKDSINESLASGQAWAQVKVNVENAGLSFSKLSDQLKAYSLHAVQLGFDDEAAALSVSKLSIITGDYTQAVQLNNLAMDLARSKNITLEEASHAIALVTQGNVRALKDYGIELGATATVADVLNEAQQKLGGSAAAFADTTQGKMAILTEQWHNMEQEIGDKITPALRDLFNTIENNMPAIESVISGLAEFISLMVEIIGPIASFVNASLAPFRLLGTVIGNVMNVSQGLPAVWDDVASSGQQVSDVNKSIADTGSTIAKNFNDIGKASKSSISAASKDVNQLKSDITALGDEYAKVASKEHQFTFQNASDFTRLSNLLLDTKTKQSLWLAQVTQGFDALDSEIKSTASTIDNLKQKLTDADAAFSDFVKSTTSTGGDDFAKIVHDAEQALPDLQKQLADAMAAGTDTTTIQKQIDDKNSIIASSHQQQYQSNAEFLDELSFLRSQDGKNELDQAYALMQRKIEIKQKETAVAKAEIQKEIDLNQQKATALNTLQDIMTAKLKVAVDARTSEMQREIDGVGMVAAAMVKAKAASDGLNTSISNFKASPALASTGSSVASTFGTMSASTPSTLGNTVFSTPSTSSLFPGLGGPMPSSSGSLSLSTQNLAIAVNDLPKSLLSIITQSLAPGMSGPMVTALQQALIGAGYSIPAGATGYYGDQTTSAVAAWQRAVGISAGSSFGYFGPISLAHIQAEPRAEGGPVSSGRPYIVGERGPELFVPGMSGGIVPNGKGAPQAPSITMHFNFNGAVAGDAGIKAIITQAITELNRQATLRGFAGK